MITRAPASRANWRAKSETPPVPWVSTTSPGFRFELGKRACQAVTRGAGQRGGLLVAEVGRDGDDARLRQHGLFRQQPIDPPAEGRAGDLGRVAAVQPRRHEQGRNAVADLPARDPRADRVDDARAVGDGDPGQGQLRVVLALDDQQVPVVQRDGPEPDPDLSMAGLGDGPLARGQGVEAEVVANLVSPHVRCLSGIGTRDHDRRPVGRLMVFALKRMPGGRRQPGGLRHSATATAACR